VGIQSRSRINVYMLNTVYTKYYDIDSERERKENPTVSLHMKKSIKKYRYEVCWTSPNFTSECRTTNGSRLKSTQFPVEIRGTEMTNSPETSESNADVDALHPP
jgi:hypothetical protein